MKKVLSLLLVLTLLFALSSCGMLARIRENAKKNAERELLATPEAAALDETLPAAIEKSFSTAHEVDAAFEISAGDVDVTGDGDVGLLDQGANMLKTLLLDLVNSSLDVDEKPVSEKDTLLEGYLLSTAADVKLERNTQEEPVTDEKGKEVADEEGQIVTRTVLADNFLKITALYYTVADENAEPEALESAVIEKVFGEARDKAAILEKLKSAENYFKNVDYTFTYAAPEVKLVLDLEAGRLTSAEFRKNVNVTLTAEGAGILEGCGSITVTFPLTDATDYTFDYVHLEDEAE